jgi:hypothetical protein
VNAGLIMNEGGNTRDTVGNARGQFIRTSSAGNDHDPVSGSHGTIGPLVSLKFHVPSLLNPYDPVISRSASDCPSAPGFLSFAGANFLEHP